MRVRSLTLALSLTGTTTLLGATRLLRTATLRCRTGIATLFWTGCGLWSALCSFSCGACLGFCFRLQACFFL